MRHALRDVPGHEGLSACVVCYAAEGELLPTCPGRRLTPSEREDCYAGRVGTVADLGRRSYVRLLEWFRGQHTLATLDLDFYERWGILSLERGQRSALDTAEQCWSTPHGPGFEDFFTWPWEGPCLG